MSDEPPDAPSPTVGGFDRTAAGGSDLDRWIAVATATLEGEGVVEGRLDLIFVDADEMAELNEAHLGHHGPTDVLAFPLDGPEDPPPRHLGDVVICPSVAEAQAPGHCGTVEAELSLLIVHGVLHVLGHDHAEPEETAVMRRREMLHLTALGHQHPEPV